jgi:hypothetical protein
MMIFNRNGDNTNSCTENESDSCANDTPVIIKQKPPADLELDQD